ncbi:2',5'-phosphodiesterase 12 [Clonorchis sinensis]|uniref:2',5'-phosphodiesterase 12 n=1 Tax=Clonorchis sinensis TaxID=79923 RepID=A0A8T1M8P1_CLOSI|nr:2',5'-phosphodiesterase 12 [Clonorchis sinensis]
MPYLSSAIMSTLAATTVCIPSTLEPQPAYVYRSKSYESSSRVCLELFIQHPAGNSLTRFRFERLASELLSASLDRIVISLNKTLEEKSKKRLKVSNVTDAQTQGFFISEAQILEGVDNEDSQIRCFEVPKSRALGDVLLPVSDTLSSNGLSSRSLFLRLYGPTEPLTFRLISNPARIHTCRLDTLPMTNYPVVPFVELEDASLMHCEFLWFVSKSTSWPSEPCHTGFIFTPRPEHLGCRLRLRVCPRNANGQMGLPYGTMRQWSKYGEPIDCKWPVALGPKQPFHEHRSKAFETRAAVDRLRVVSYNLLADLYSSTEAARDIIFRHCPLEYLDQKYRLPLILREVLSYHADLICLQEVDGSVFSKYFKPALDYAAGMNGIYLSKRALTQVGNDPPRTTVSLDVEKGEGCALFYNRSRLELIRDANILSLMTYAENEPMLSELVQSISEEVTTKHVPEIFSRDFETSRVKSYTHGLVTALFRLKLVPSVAVNKEPPVDRLLVVGNTHFYFHPVADYFRYVQARVVRYHLNKMAVAASAEFGLSVSILLCGDINQSPEGPAYQALLETEAISSTHPVSLSLKSAYGSNADSFTNWVPGFYALLDVIMYSPATGMTCLQTLPLCSRDEITRLLSHDAECKPVPRGEPVDEQDLYALPNAQFPSDHLSLVADFTWHDKESSGH